MADGEAERQRREVEGEREVFTYMYLLNGAYVSLEQVEEHKEHCMTVILYCALTLEAYLNHLGSKVFAEHVWRAVERQRPLEKLETISTEIGYKLDRGRPPFQSFRPIFAFRNALAHGKSASLQYENEQYLAKADPPAHPKAEWEKQLTVSAARAFYHDTESMMNELHGAADLDHELITFSWTSSWSMK